MLVPECLTDENEKPDCANMARPTCFSHVATSCVMVIEACAKFRKANERIRQLGSPFGRD